MYNNNGMLFEWDEKKRQTNLKKHGLDFNDVSRVFAGTCVSYEDIRQDYGEQRIITVGMYKSETVVVVVHTNREDMTRIISFRKASQKERRIYYGDS
jgi:uncharacterized DUF497 family protein